MDKEKCCGTCKYHKPSTDWLGKREWLCMNEDADAYGLATEYSDTCEEWEER